MVMVGDGGGGGGAGSDDDDDECDEENFKRYVWFYRQPA